MMMIMSTRDMRDLLGIKKSCGEETDEKRLTQLSYCCGWNDQL